MGECKPVDKLTVEDLTRYPIWEFDLENEDEDGQDETWVKPVKQLPVTDLSNRIVGIPVRFAGGTTGYALLGNIDLQHLRKTQQFLVLTLVIGDGDWFHLARYHDSDYARNGPEALARHVNLSLEEIFPITYDISTFTRGLDAVVRGSIPAEPVERLTDDERMALIFE
ncbi:MAG TPA: hypothetical protein PLZ36_08795 [Armatimonadota bacterium]|nr:hypothetical protein [Armatimonadota bacterium]